MKRKVICLLVVVLLLAGLAGGGTFAYQYYRKASTKGLFNRFLGLDGEGTEAVCDIDIIVTDINGEEVFCNNEGDQFSIRDLKHSIKDSDSEFSRYMDLYYAFLYEDTNNPVLALMIQGGDDSKYQNSTIMFFTAKDGEVHLSSIQNPITSFMGCGEVHLSKDGAITAIDYLLGDELKDNYQLATNFVNQDGLIAEGFEWVSMSSKIAPYMTFDDVVFPLYAQYYRNSDAVTMSMITLGDETYFYYDGTENKEFDEACEAKGKNVTNDEEELYGIIDDYFQSINVKVKMKDIEDNDVDWEEVD